MAKPLDIYDSADWHLEGDFPKRLPDSQAYVHGGFYLAWLAENNLLSKSFLSDFPKEVAKLSKHKLSGPGLFQIADGILDSDMLTTEGNRFTAAYYWSGTYFDDYSEAFPKYATLYHVRDTWANFEKIAALVSARFQRFRAKPRKRTGGGQELNSFRVNRSKVTNRRLTWALQPTGTRRTVVTDRTVLEARSGG